MQIRRAQPYWVQMDLAPPPETGSRVQELGDRLVVHFQPRRSWFEIAFLTFWLTFWTAGGIAALTFPVYVQCKRHRGSVGAGAVRDFRGAMAGRGGKGLLITTGSFTGEARQEAARDGATPVDLVDGEELCDLLKRFGLGVQTQLREIEEVTLEPSFFDDI
jgi:hypothetical protein